MRFFQRIADKQKQTSLPGSAADKLRTMEEATDAARARSRNLLERANDARNKLRGLETERATLMDAFAIGGLQTRSYDGPGQHRTTNGRGTLTEIDRVIERQQQIVAELNAAYETVRRGASTMTVCTLTPHIRGSDGSDPASDHDGGVRRGPVDRRRRMMSCRPVAGSLQHR